MRKPVIAMLCVLVALALLLHGAAAVACDSSGPVSGTDAEMTAEMVAGCPACTESDTVGAGADSCNVACSSVMGCIHATALSKPAERAYVSLAGPSRTERPQAVEPPPPRAMLLA